MPITYEPIATTTLANATTLTVTFSSIPATYTDLVAVIAGTHTSALTGFTCDFNNVTGGGVYSRTVLIGNGSAASSSRDSSQDNLFAGLLGTGQSNTIINIMNYSNATTYKTLLSRMNDAGNTVRAQVGLWRDTAAINRIDFTMGSNYFGNGTTFTLYGIKSA